MKFASHYSIICSYLKSPISDTARANFERYRKSFPPDTDIVALGGYHNLISLSEDPKSVLISTIISQIKSKDGNIAAIDDSNVDALITLLQCAGKGFQSDIVDGEWAPVLSRQGKKSSKIQKKVEKKVTLKSAFSNFNVREREFLNINYTPRRNGQLEALVKVSSEGTMNLS